MITRRQTNWKSGVRLWSANMAESEEKTVPLAELNRIFKGMDCENERVFTGVEKDRLLHKLFDSSDVGREVTLMGWVQTRRDLGRADLCGPAGPHRHHAGRVSTNRGWTTPFAKAAEGLRSEYVIAVRGPKSVEARPEETINEKMPTGLIEVKVQRNSKLLSSAKTPPFEIEDGTGSA